MTTLLVDCNNFFVSCERLFKPSLEGKPVVVLSNNDGCIISRSEEAKKIGIPMGVPFFQVKELCKVWDVAIFSPNFSLYADISERIMQILGEEVHLREIYSIDEAFLPLDFHDLEAVERFALHIRAKIKQWVGVPVSVGGALTKTLAKIAADIAKKQTKGVYILQDKGSILENVPVEKIWGIGRKTALFLKKRSITTAAQFIQQEALWVKAALGVTGERIHKELQGISCLGEKSESGQSITYARSFGKKVESKESLQEALATYTFAAARKLRKRGKRAGGLYVYLQEALSSGTYKSFQKALFFSCPTDHSHKMIKRAHEGLDILFKPGLIYRKCGVVLFDLSTDKQMDLFASHPKEQLCDQVIDRINDRFGKGSLFYLGMGLKRPWQMRSQRKSPAYTTSWDQLPLIR